MLDQSLRRYLRDPLDLLGRELIRFGVRPNAVTAVGFVVGLGAVAAASQSMWWLALALWLANRAGDGLDGPMARAQEGGPTELGGFLDIVADFAIYGAMIAALGYAVPEARFAALVVLVAYYVNGAAFLAWSGLESNRGAEGDGRSLLFPSGLAEGTETIVAYIAFLVFPGQLELLLWIWGAAVWFTVGQRVVGTVAVLRNDQEGPQH